MDWKEVDLEVLEAIPEPTRTMAPFRWPGGKGHLAKWVVSYLPRNAKVYVEPYAGAASVLWHLPEPYPIEVLNDLDERIVNLFRVLQDREKFEELLHRLVWTPYARSEFVRALGYCPPGRSMMRCRGRGLSMLPKTRGSAGGPTPRATGGAL